MQGSYFPRFPSTDRLYSIRVRTALEDWWGAPTSPEWRINDSYETMMGLTLVGMQGVINRGGPAVYLDWEDLGKYGDAARYWIPMLRRHVGVAEMDLDGLSAVNFLFRRYGNRFKGAVVYDPEVPDTINLATTLAGSEDRIMLAPEQLTLPGISELLDTLEEQYDPSQNPLRLPTLAGYACAVDLQTLAGWQNWDTSDPGKYRLYQWVYDNLWPSLEQRVIGVISPGPPTSRLYNEAAYDPLGIATRDYIVALRLPVLWISPVDEPEATLFAQYLQDAPAPIPVYSFFDGQEVGTVSLASEHGDWVAVITNSNAPLSAGNLSVFSGVTSSIQPYQSELDRDRILASLDGRPVMMLWNSDGDALHIQMDHGIHGGVNFVWDDVHAHRFGKAMG